jgi:hypothetical protein
VAQVTKQLQTETASYIYTAAKESQEIENAKNGGQQWIEEGLQELQAIAHRLERDQQQLNRVESGRVYWATSSVTGYRFLKGGARQKAVQ